MIAHALPFTVFHGAENAYWPIAALYVASLWVGTRLLLRRRK